MKKKLIGVVASLGFAQLALFGTAAWAQEKSGGLLNEVVVTASRSPKKQSEIGKVVRVITSEQLKRSQGRTLPEVLNHVAGLTLSGTANGPGSNVSVFMRGASAGYTLILIDGIPVNNASSISGEYDLTSFSIDQIERVEILRGVNSTLYGSDAVAGVINIVTKVPSKDKINGDVLLSGGSYHTFKEAIGLNGTLNKTGIAINLSNTASKGFSVANNAFSGTSFDKDGLNQSALNAKILQEFSDKFSISANLQLSRNRFDMDGGAFADDPNYAGKNSFLFGGLTGKYILPKGSLQFNVNQNNVWNTFLNEKDAVNTSYDKQNNQGRITYSEALLDQQITEDVGIIAGINHRYTASDQTYESVSSFGPYNTYLSADTANSNIFSGFASLFFKHDSGLRFELGGRYNHHSEYGSNFTYTINPSFIIAQHFKVFASVASAYKVPSIYQLYSQFGNQRLRPEQSISYETGFDLELVPAKLNFSSSFFKRDITNLMYFYTDPVTFASQYRNGVSQKDKGLEVELNTSPTEKLSFNVWYAYVEGKSEAANGKVTEYLFRRPKNSFGANAGYQFNKAVALSLIYKYTGKRPEQFFNETTFATEIMELKAYSLMEIYLQVNPHKRLTFFADIRNVFDTDYIEWRGYTTRGRNFNAGIKYTFR